MSLETTGVCAHLTSVTNIYPNGGDDLCVLPDAPHTKRRRAAALQNLAEPQGFDGLFVRAGGTIPSSTSVDVLRVR
jgi:hypothetical protein